jgi:hypothetical protein
MISRIDAREALIDAVAKLIKAKGRFHTEQNYSSLVAAFDSFTTDRAAVAKEGGEAQDHVATERHHKSGSLNAAYQGIGRRIKKLEQENAELRSELIEASAATVEPAKHTQQAEVAEARYLLKHCLPVIRKHGVKSLAVEVQNYLAAPISEGVIK